MLPETVQVKISSEAGGAIQITRVVIREMAVIELIHEIALMSGPDPQRISHLLRVGTFAREGSRYRWNRIDAEPAAVESLLSNVP